VLPGVPRRIGGSRGLAMLLHMAVRSPDTDPITPSHRRPPDTSSVSSSASAADKTAARVLIPAICRPRPVVSRAAHCAGGCPPCTVWIDLGAIPVAAIGLHWEPGVTSAVFRHFAGCDARSSVPGGLSDPAMLLKDEIFATVMRAILWHRRESIIVKVHLLHWLDPLPWSRMRSTQCHHLSIEIFVRCEAA